MKNEKKYRNVVSFTVICFIFYLCLTRLEMKIVSATQTDILQPEVVLICEDIDCLDENEIVCKVQVSKWNREHFKIDVVVNRMDVYGVTETTTMKDVVFEDDQEKELKFTKEGSYKVYAEIIDQFGNVISTKELNFVIDRSDPLIFMEKSHGGKVSYSTALEKLGMVFYVRDLSLEKESCEVEIRQNGKKWEKYFYDSVTGTNTMTMTVYFDQMTPDGEYEITLSGRDGFGKRTEKAFAVIIDNTVMTIEDIGVDYQKEVIKSPNRICKNGKEIAYFNDAVIIHANIAEANYKDSKIFVNTYRNQVLVDNKVIDMEKKIENLMIVYREEGCYETVIHGKDAAGNETASQSVYYVIDRTAPEFRMTQMYRDEESIMEEEQFLAVDKNRLFRCYFKEQNQSRDSYKINIKYKQKDDDKPIVTVLEGEEIEWKEGEAEDEIYFEIKHLLRAEGFYTVIITGTDMAGNQGIKKKLLFCIDSTPPVIKNIRYLNEDGVLKEKYNTIFSRKELRLEFTIIDHGSGVENVYITVGSKEVSGARRYKAHKGDGDTYYISIPSDLKVDTFDDAITIWARDRLENVTKLTSSRVVYRIEKPVIRMGCDEDYKNWTNKNLVFTTRIEDHVSGLREVTYKANEKIIKKITFDKPVYSFTYDVVVSEDATLPDGYFFVVEVTNNNGIINADKCRVYVDKTKPFVELSGVKNSKHYKENQKITVKVKDVSYKDAETICYVERSQNGETVDVRKFAYESKDVEDQFACEIKKQGEYRVYAVTTDSAGNRKKTDSLYFVIDKEAPVLSIDGIEDKSVENKAVTLKFTSEEKFFKTNNVKIKVERFLEGDTIVDEEKKVLCNAKKSILEKSFSEDGIYKITIMATDKAGNVAQEKSIHFTVDKTSPSIQIEGCENYQIFSRPLSIEWIVEESFYEGNRIELNGTRKDIEGIVENLELPTMKSTGKISTLKQSFQEDGIYELKMTSKDRAGNQETKVIHFTIDSTSPEIHNFEQYGGKYYQVFQMTDSLENMFRDLTVISYRMLLNGVEYNGVDKVTQEGKYCLSVDLSDELGHRNWKEIEFIVDRTPPKIIFNGVRDGGIVKEKGIVTFRLVDEEDQITGIRMNGTEYDTQIKELVYSEYGNYHIEVDCVDYAGNQITHHLRFMYVNPIVKVYLAVVILFFVCGIVVLLKRKRSRV